MGEVYEVVNIAAGNLVGGLLSLGFLVGLVRSVLLIVAITAHEKSNRIC
jgi:hypothetical protein